MTSPPVIRFDEWTVETRSGELARGSVRVRLQTQPLQLLIALLERPGELVTREELVARLWPKGVVDFESGLNAAVRRLRSALDDDAETPRYIETLPRRGYRFIGRVAAQSPPIAIRDDRTISIGVTDAPLARRDCIVIVHAPPQLESGRRCALHRDVATIGRGAENDIVLLSPGVSRRHARIERRGDSLYIADEGSTNGVLINDGAQPVSEARLQSGDEIVLGDVILKHLGGSDVEAAYRRWMHEAAHTDGLTGLCARHRFDALLDMERSRALRHARPLALMFLEFNDVQDLELRYGPLAGGSLLRGLGHLLRKRLRPHDVAARWSADRLAVLLPETSEDGAQQIARTLQGLAAARAFPAGRRELHATISAGVAALGNESRIDDLYAAAAAALRREQ